MSSNAAAPAMTTLKISYKGEIHRLRIDLNIFSFVALNDLFDMTFNLDNVAYSIIYKDNENDVLNVTSELEFEEACRVFTNNNGEVKSLRFHAVSSIQRTFQKDVAEPVLKAIEHLVESLNVAMEKIKKEEWAQRAQAGAQMSGEVISEAYQQAVSASKQSFASAKKTLNEIEFERIMKETAESAKNSLNEIEFEKLMKETAEGIKVAAEGFSTYAQDLVEQLKANNIESQSYESVETNSTTDDEDDDEVEEPKSEEPEIVVAAEVQAEQQTDYEWEQVAETTPVAVPVQVTVASPSAEELKWATEISKVREIFPNADLDKTIDLLESSRGNVEIVLNALFEV